MNEAKIRVRDNGPLIVDGSTPLVDGAGDPIDCPASDKGNIALCRCGASAAKPFCDGAHREIDFQSEVRSSESP